jgi:ABC-2 type transport system permease protein
MPTWGRWVAPFSPLTYASDLLRGGLGELRFFPAWVDFLALAAFAAGFLALARHLHHRRDRGL